ncbi:MAG: hypothetical protein CMJ16_03515 [Peredibacter sp.]|nr:hypothetical protein [Peredibacter sp.]
MNFKILLLLFIFASCSSLKRTLITSAATGALVGASGGATFSPDDESRAKNAYLFGLLGAAAGVGLGYLFFDDPEKKKVQTPMILDGEVESHKEVPLFDFSPELKDVRPEVTFKPVKKYEVPMEKLPKELEGKVKKQYIIEYEAQARTINLGNRTIEISPFKALEHVYEK